jgi:hypothetical protein
VNTTKRDRLVGFAVVGMLAVFATASVLGLGPATDRARALVEKYVPPDEATAAAIELHWVSVRDAVFEDRSCTVEDRPERNRGLALMQNPERFDPAERAQAITQLATVATSLVEVAILVRVADDDGRALAYDDLRPMLVRALYCEEWLSTAELRQHLRGKEGPLDVVDRVLVPRGHAYVLRATRVIVMSMRLREAAHGLLKLIAGESALARRIHRNFTPVVDRVSRFRSSRRPPETSP